MSDVSKDEQTGRRPAGEVVVFNLQDEIQRARNEPQSEADDRNAISLVKHRDFTVTLLMLRKGAHLHEHSVKGSVSVQVISGAIRFSVAGNPKTISPGMICVIDREIPHSVEALEDSTFLLTAALPGQ